MIICIQIIVMTLIKSICGYYLSVTHRSVFIEGPFLVTKSGRKCHVLSVNNWTVFSIPLNIQSLFNRISSFLSCAISTPSTVIGWFTHLKCFSVYNVASEDPILYIVACQAHPALVKRVKCWPMFLKWSINVYTLR